MERQKIMVIGGSASSNFGNLHSESAWPELLARNLEDIARVFHITRAGLTFVRGISELSEIDHTDVLILHFGTSIGWPVSLIRTGTKFGIDFASDTAFHQPAGKSKSKLRKIKYFIKRRFRNLIKYVLFFTGLYKPKASKREMNDQIEAVLKIASQKSDNFIWIQHRAFLNHRILLEKWVYERYYSTIIKRLKQVNQKGFHLLEIPQDFNTSDNYLFDCVHLSQKGHIQFENIVRRALTLNLKL